MDKQLIKILLIEIEVLDVVNNAFFEEERKQYHKILKSLKLTTRKLCQFIIENEELVFKIFENPDFYNKSRYVEFYNIGIKYFDINTANLESIELLKIYFKKIMVILYDKEDKDSESKELFRNFTEKTSLLDARFPIIPKSEDTNQKGTPFFQLNESIKIDLAILRSNLVVKNSFVCQKTTIESFEMVFGKKRKNKSFKKIDWIGSIYELKKFINLLQNKKIIPITNNYLDTIIYCFTKNNNNLSRSQILNPRGSQRNLDILDSIIEKSLRNSKHS